MRKDGYDKSFASPEDYEDGFQESDMARMMRESAIAANVVRKYGTPDELPVVSKPVLPALEKPSSPVIDKPGDKNPYWTMDGKQRDKYVNFLLDTGFTEDDHADFAERVDYYGMDSLTEDEQMLMNMSKDDVINGWDFIDAIKADEKSKESHQIDTGRYVKISYYVNGLPDRTDGRYSNPYDKSQQPYAPTESFIAYESVPSGDMHEFWKMDEKKNHISVVCADIQHYTVNHVLTSKESEKYQARRDAYAATFDKNVSKSSSYEKLLRLAGKDRDAGDDGGSTPPPPGE